MPLTPVLSYTLWKDQGGVGGRADTKCLLQKVVPWCGTLSFKSRSYVWREAGDGGTQCPRYRYLDPLYCSYICNTNYACGAWLLSRVAFSTEVRRNGRTLLFRLLLCTSRVGSLSLLVCKIQRYPGSQYRIVECHYRVSNPHPS